MSVIKQVPAQAALATSSLSFGPPSFLPCAFSHSCEEPEARAFLIARSQRAAKPRPMFLVWGHSEKQDAQPGLRYLQQEAARREKGCGATVCWLVRRRGAPCRKRQDQRDEEQSRGLLLRGRERVELGERRRQCEQRHAANAARAHHSLLATFAAVERAPPGEGE